MDIAEIENRLAGILADDYDADAAHCQIDKLYIDTLKAIAAGHPDAQALASAALKGEEIVFVRETS